MGACLSESSKLDYEYQADAERFEVQKKVSNLNFPQSFHADDDLSKDNLFAKNYARPDSYLFFQFEWDKEDSKVPSIFKSVNQPSAVKNGLRDQIQKNVRSGYRDVDDTKSVNIIQY